MSTEPIHLVEGTYAAADVDNLRTTNHVVSEVDLLDDQLRELAAVRLLAGSADLLGAGHRDLRGDWFYAPWSGLLVHLVTRSEFDELRTNRNRNIIRSEEQSQLLLARVAIAGLSIGGNVAITLARAGIGAVLRLADFDAVETTNLNRAPYPFYAVGCAKTDAIRRGLFDVTPFIEVELFARGVETETVGAFCEGQDLVFDEIDDLAMKLAIRGCARELGIPVAMITNLGDSLLIDVERYDLDRTLPFFNERVPGVEDLAAANLSDAEVNALAVRIVGPENVPTRTLGSLPEIGRTLVGRPQVASTTNAGGGVAALVAREILTGDRLRSGRYRVSFSEHLAVDPDPVSDATERERIFATLVREPT